MLAFLSICFPTSCGCFCERPHRIVAARVVLRSSRFGVDGASRVWVWRRSESIAPRPLRCSVLSHLRRQGRPSSRCCRSGLEKWLEAARRLMCSGRSVIEFSRDVWSLGDALGAVRWRRQGTMLTVCRRVALPSGNRVARVLEQRRFDAARASAAVHDAVVAAGLRLAWSASLKRPRIVAVGRDSVRECGGYRRPSRYVRKALVRAGAWPAACEHRLAENGAAPLLAGPGTHRGGIDDETGIAPLVPGRRVRPVLLAAGNLVPCLLSAASAPKGVRLPMRFRAGVPAHVLCGRLMRCM